MCDHTRRGGREGRLTQSVTGRWLGAPRSPGVLGASGVLGWSRGLGLGRCRAAVARGVEAALGPEWGRLLLGRGTVAVGELASLGRSVGPLAGHPWGRAGAAAPPRVS